ncbi:hypothetical protein WA538_005294 [Blastocystis sp. DL]
MKGEGWELGSQEDSDDITVDGNRRDFDDTDNGEDSPFPAGESEKNIREDTSLFVKESVRRLCQQRDEAAAKRLCESVGRLWEEGRVEESMIHDDLIDLKNVYRECRDIDALMKKLFKDGG